MGHEELFKFSTRGFARYGNQNAAVKKDTRIIGGYITDKYEYFCLQLLSNLHHWRSTMPGGKWKLCKFCLILRRKNLCHKKPTLISIECYNTPIYIDYFDAFHCLTKSAL